mmetsp:Transcript_88476/g.250790  ORF Transcript_88476/g.250790 Transcript_88476/m.250790 type:complete len:344 (-) Transcript_88476:122-1153(-)
MTMQRQGHSLCGALLLLQCCLMVGRAGAQSADANSSETSSATTTGTATATEPTSTRSITASGNASTETTTATPTTTGAATCSGASAMPVGGSGTTCPAAMAEGRTCQAVCGSSEVATGSFLCGSGQIWGVSVCVSSAANTTTVVVDTVLGSFSVALASCPPQQALKSILARAFGLAPEQVLSSACRVPGAARRLAGSLRGASRELQAARELELTYELVSNSSATSAGLVQRAGDIAANGSAASARFLGAFAAEGLAAPTAVSAGIAPTIVAGVELVVDSSGGYVTPAGTPAPTPSPAPAEQEGGSKKRLAAGLAISGALLFLGLLCLGVICCCTRRRHRQLEA